VRKHDVIHKTGSTQHITMTPKQTRDRIIGNTHKKFGEVQLYGFWVMRVDRNKTLVAK